MRLQQAILFVKDLDRMADFYSGLLGLKIRAETRTNSWVEMDGLALHAIPPHIADSIEIATPPVAREDNPIKLVFAVDDPQAEKTRLAALGVVFVERPWGGYDALDPEGNVFQLCPVP